MDLFLMDLILKGHIHQDMRVLDIGCGEGRNGIYFLREGMEYHGWDRDASKVKLLEYLASELEGANGRFRVGDFIEGKDLMEADLIICSRVLHFATSESHLFEMWGALTDLLKQGGLLYVSMDSMVNTNIGVAQKAGMHQFPDSKVRFVLTSALYQEMKKGFEEIEPLRTLVHHEQHAQSFMILRKR